MLTSVRLAEAVTRLNLECAEPGATVDGILRRLCMLAQGELDVEGAGVMRADGPALRFVHAVPAGVESVESLQETLQSGPCCDSLATADPVTVDDLAGCSQWPELVAESAVLGMGSAMSMPLLADDQVWGVLDLYRALPSAWSEGEVSTVRALADVAAFHVALVAERARVEEERDLLLHRVSHDELTGLPTRGLLMDRLEQAILASHRQRSAVAVLFIDVDGFKQLNDTHGHAFGDRVLVEVAARVRQTLRAGDTLARLCGDEFVVLCADLTGSSTQVRRWLHVLGRRIQLALRRPPRHGEVEIQVSVSIGVMLTARPHRAADLLQGADRAMYQAKLRGGGQLVISQTDIGPIPVEVGRPDG
jgi:diguanylate cyclase (GGDEF)-like protein